MEQMNLYAQIAKRTDGDIYIGVVGPVRTGKSTFIKKFMEMLVLPNIENPYRRERTVDELPQSGAGRTIMTTQPHFVPNEAVQITLDDEATFNVRMVDCVGYMIKGALGTTEAGEARMVSTPWYDHDIPFEQAAELGTKKVISEHSTIGVVVTTDGSITDLPRAAYIDAEERVIGELKDQGKPFIILLNSTHPQQEEVLQLREGLESKYNVPVLSIDVLQMQMQDIKGLLETVLFEFPLAQAQIDLPKWMQVLPEEHWLIAQLLDQVRGCGDALAHMRDYKMLLEALGKTDAGLTARASAIELGKGVAKLSVEAPEGLYYQILGEECGTPIYGDYHLLALLKELVSAKREYDQVEKALKDVRETGYGMVSPTLAQMTLEEPEIVRQGNRFGVRLKASAPSLHMMRVDIETEVLPLVGTERQSEELVQYLLDEFESDPSQIWTTNIFGKSLHELVQEGLANKLARMPEDAQLKIAETLQRIINEGSGGLICILL